MSKSKFRFILLIAMGILVISSITVVIAGDIALIDPSSIQLLTVVSDSVIIKLIALNVVQDAYVDGQVTFIETDVTNENLITDFGTFIKAENGRMIRYDLSFLCLLDSEGSGNWISFRYNSTISSGGIQSLLNDPDCRNP